MALFGSFAVSIMQQSPDATFLMLPNISISATMLPAGVLIIALLSSLAVQSFAPLILSTGGVLSTYWYLRYIRIVDGHKGDRSIGMSFSIMFPPILRPLGELLAERSYQIAAKYDKWSLLQDTDLEGRPTTRRLSAQEEGRRRQLALQLLNEKMSQKREKEGAPEILEELTQSSTGNPNIPLETGRPMMLQQA
ncbi:hypothetical protein PSACC_02595 [Paramicrosporidium saccamoebae]|uniref:Uncharacterized protein n=1 Tax=Paramicrosporidium saccamoebae TaxID=1246581 RepID=A0A2H9TIL3_9FUNG|nr:hypothetical protein PSACC_02595 [Paramicrosporidium saccamoebae]